MPLVWIVGPEQNTVSAHRSLEDARRFVADEVITAEPILAGFSCKVSEFFASYAHH